MPLIPNNQTVKNQGILNLKNSINTKMNEINPILMPQYLFFMNPHVLDKNLIYNLEGIEDLKYKNQEIEINYELK